jgi:DNA mismatch repair ATPase MutS
MDVKQDEDGKLNFNYKLKHGICNIQGAIEILKAMDYPNDIIETIQKYDDVSINRSPEPITETDVQFMP